MVGIMTPPMVRKRLTVLSLCLASLLPGCGADEMSLTEYVDRLNAIVDRARQQHEVFIARSPGRVLVAEGEELLDFTPQDLQVGLERLLEIGEEVMQSINAIEPPELIAGLHYRYFDDRFSTAAEALAARAGTAADWYELSATPEMAAYRKAIEGDKEVCIQLQSDLDATAARGVFSDNPWLPAELKQVVEAVIGCAGYPENVDDLFRPPPSTVP